MNRPQLEGKRILVIVYGHVADTIAAIPGLRTLRHSYPRAQIVVLALKPAAAILAGCPYVDELMVWQDLRFKGRRFARAEKLGALASLALQVRNRRFDAVIVFHRSFGFLRRVAGASGARVVAGLDYGGDSYTHRAPRPGQPESSRDENRRVLEALGLAEDGGPVELWTNAAEWAAAQSLTSGDPSRPLIGLHPGSDWSCQQWLPGAFSAVGRRLQLSLGARLVITGSASEQALQDEIADGLVEPPIKAAGRTTLGELVALTRRLDLMISVNSSAAAIARAVGTPAVILLGPEDARFTGLQTSDRVRPIQAPAAVNGGGWCEFGRWGLLSSCESPMCRGLGGLADVKPDRVYLTAMNLLGSTPRLAGLARRIPQEVAT